MSVVKSNSSQSSTDSDNQLFIDRKPSPGCLSTRFKIASMSMLACAVMFINRVNLNVAIVSMSTQSATDSTTINMTSICRSSFNETGPINETINQHLVSSTSKPEFHWSQSTQGLILGSFYWGHICFQTIGSRLAELFGAKWICGLGILISGIINFATPIIARTNSLYIFIGSRIVLGLAQSAVFPSFYALFTKWFPSQERSNYLPWLDFGCVLGTVIATAASGLIIDSSIFGGWPAVFYVSGLLAIIWFVCWAIYARSDPRQSPFISQKELNFIIANTEDELVLSGKQKPSVPWIQILTSKTFIGVFVTKVTLGFTYSLLLTKLPTYLQNVIDVPIDQNGLINSYVNIGYGFTLLTGGYLATLMLRKTGWSTTTVRKIFESVYGLTLTACLILIPVAGCNQLVVIIILFLASASTGLQSGGDIPIVTEMTSQFPATVYSLMNMFISLTGFLSPWTVGLIINSDPFSMVLWSYVFYIAAGLSVLGTVTFVLLAQAKRQPWDCLDN